MTLRLKLFVAAIVCIGGLVNAQGVYVAPSATPDPYAMSPAATNPYWWGNGYSVPTTTCIRDRFWVSADYLYWWTDGMEVPPLVTSSPNGTPSNVAGELDRSDTSILYGNTTLHDGSINGARLRSGWWFRTGRAAIESEFFGFESSTENYSASSDGSRILARPYYDIANGQEAAHLIAYPNLVTGDVSVDSKSQLKSGLLHFRRSFLPIGMLGCNDGCDPPDRVDWIAGYRMVNLKDELRISENRTALVPGDPDTSASSDSFTTENDFSGLQLGVIYQAHFRRLWMESMIRVALGNNRQKANISGQTSITDGGVTNDYEGGLLAQRTNRVRYQNDQFILLPELGLNFGLRITRCLHAMVGYNLIYFPSVLRAGEQIDLDLNPGLIPPEAVMLTGPLRPRFRPVESDYWAHGLNFGAQLRF